MSKRQPTLKEAQNLVNWGRLGRYWVKMKLSRNGKRILNWQAYNAAPIYSDITERCHDCNRVLRDAKDSIGRNTWKTAGKNNFSKRGMSSWPETIDVCLGCYNKRRPAIDAVFEWAETRRVINRIERELSEQRKNNRTTS